MEPKSVDLKQLQAILKSDFCAVLNDAQENEEKRIAQAHQQRKMYIQNLIPQDQEQTTKTDKLLNKTVAVAARIRWIKQLYKCIVIDLPKQAISEETNSVKKQFEIALKRLKDHVCSQLRVIAFNLQEQPRKKWIDKYYNLNYVVYIQQAIQHYMIFRKQIQKFVLSELAIISGFQSSEFDSQQKFTSFKQQQQNLNVYDCLKVTFKKSQIKELKLIQSHFVQLYINLIPLIAFPEEGSDEQQKNKQIELMRLNFMDAYSECIIFMKYLSNSILKKQLKIPHKADIIDKFCNQIEGKELFQNAFRTFGTFLYQKNGLSA